MSRKNIEEEGQGHKLTFLLKTTTSKFFLLNIGHHEYLIVWKCSVHILNSIAKYLQFSGKKTYQLFSLAHISSYSSHSILIATSHLTNSSIAQNVPLYLFKKRNVFKCHLSQIDVWAPSLIQMPSSIPSEHSECFIPDITILTTTAGSEIWISWRS